MNTDKKIIIYTTDWCPYCHVAKDHLKKRGVEYIEKNIEDDPANREELIAKIGGKFRGVPVLDINGEIIQDSSKAAIYAALDKSDI